ncbi:MAG: four helix bundle protein [Bacteroidetes bacterium]|nr:four helix bundle protein [Bacteroidota bacterium]
MKAKKYDLEDRLVTFTCTMMDVVEALPESRSGMYLAVQLLKACHSPALRYAEVASAASFPELLYCLSVLLRQLHDCRVSLKIIAKKQMIMPVSKLDEIFRESQELISIISGNIRSAKRKYENIHKKHPDVAAA